MLYCQAAQAISGEKKNTGSFLVIRGRFSCYSQASVWTSVGAGSGVWLSTFTEAHMADHWSLKTLDHDAVCVVKGTVRVT